MPVIKTTPATVHHNGFVYRACLIAESSGTASSKPSSSLRAETVQVIEHRLAILGTKFSGIHGLLNLRLAFVERHDLLQLVICRSIAG
jgi:hypothetical protein